MSIDLDRDRLVEMLERQSEIGGTERGGLHRLALTGEGHRARDWLVERMEAAGLDVRIDRMGNTFGRREGPDPEAAPLLRSGTYI